MQHHKSEYTIRKQAKKNKRQNKLKEADIKSK